MTHCGITDTNKAFEEHEDEEHHESVEMIMIADEADTMDASSKLEFDDFLDGLSGTEYALLNEVFEDFDEKVEDENLVEKLVAQHQEMDEFHQVLDESLVHLRGFTDELLSKGLLTKEELESLQMHDLVEHANKADEESFEAALREYQEQNGLDSSATNQSELLDTGSNCKPLSCEQKASPQSSTSIGEQSSIVSEDSKELASGNGSDGLLKEDEESQPASDQEFDEWIGAFMKQFGEAFENGYPTDSDSDPLTSDYLVNVALSDVLPDIDWLLEENTELIKDLIPQVIQDLSSGWLVT
ncbi:expressed unknown protein [Seminavis robusta]|uniref:Uncharacterized protein n=1 Tax=Seminavis robusta TaxID=568900 RepID=A0A9N8H3I7_9STRA|nr:expressed unknown protein [Seminavis robusta]|eukprot:Sro88_g046530.1 n/a (299) ;mRNA; f:68472-69368